MLTLNRNDFISALRFALFTVAKQDIREYLRGVMLYVGSDHLKVVSSDGRRLSVAHLDVACVPSEMVGRKDSINKGSIVQLIENFTVARNDRRYGQFEEIRLHIGSENAGIKVVTDDVEIKLLYQSVNSFCYSKILEGREFGLPGAGGVIFHNLYMADAAKAFAVLQNPNKRQLKIEFSSDNYTDAEGVSLAAGVTRITPGLGINSCGQLKDAALYLLPVRDLLPARG